MGFIEIYVNGHVRQVPESYSVARLLDEMDLVGQRIATEINHEILPRSQHSGHTLRPGDRVEIVRAIGGG